jgi:pimeloyl-ACP methyl ester carboxylesterase
VLLLHGFGDDHRSLLFGVGPAFERRPGYRRIHVDLPGFGESPPDPTIDSSDAMVDVVIDIIDEAIGAERFVVVGESWGAYLARAVVTRRRSQVIGVALIVPVIIATHTDRDIPEPLLLAEEPDVLEGVGPVDAAAFREGAVIIDRASWDYVRTTILPSMAAADNEANEAIAAAYAFATDVDAIGEPFEGPSLIVAGRQDSVVGYRDSIRLVERYPRSTFAVLDAAGHMLEGERPGLLAALVDDWLDRVERT